MSGESPRRVAILGSTGTIGRQTCDVISRLGDRFEITSLAAHRNVSLLAEQTIRFRPWRVAIGDPGCAAELRARLASYWRGEILEGERGLEEIARSGDAKIVVNALVGTAGLAPSLAALRAGSDVALANKESLVIAGELLRRTAEASGARILPVDSEHSGLLQCLDGHGASHEIERIILTASGGPFRTRPMETFRSVTPEEALRHPTWRMGPRITVDSATLLNKGFEIHEARWLFDIPLEKIDVWIHPQSVVHALVEFTDGSWIAQLSAPDMRLPIQFALCYPERPASQLPRCDLTTLEALAFEEVDLRRYPCLVLARAALEAGGTVPAALNAADEVLVEAFLGGSIPFTAIAENLARVCDATPDRLADRIESILETDQWAREKARSLVGET
jgi:1-deoxy-D-xylulose-5-phosphate reductoisomerase